MSRNGKPLDLPGLYWDDERQRYFPLASRPKRKAVEEEIDISKHSADQCRLSNKRPTPISNYTRALQSGTKNFAQRAQIAHEIEGSTLTTSFVELDPPVRPLSWQTSKISAFHAATVDDTLNVLVGDTRGVLHCSRAMTQTKSKASNNPERFNDNSRLFTSYHLGSGSAITHIARSKDVAVSVSSTCDSCLLGIRDLKAPDYSGVSFPRIKIGGDVRAASLFDKRLALGISGKLVLIKDIGGPGCVKTYNTCHTKSDVLSLIQGSNTTTAGLRNGEVRLFDVREHGTSGVELLGSRFCGTGSKIQKTGGIKPRKGHSAITHLQGVREWELLVGTSAGELEIFDLRFATGDKMQSSMIFEGHVNSYLLDLGITTDPTSSFLYAAGQDRRIRAWSLRTGDLLGTLLDGAQLQTPARSLAVTQAPTSGQNDYGTYGYGGRQGGSWLWVAQEEEVRVVRLGGL